MNSSWKLKVAEDKNKVSTEADLEAKWKIWIYLIEVKF